MLLSTTKNLRICWWETLVHSPTRSKIANDDFHQLIHEIVFSGILFITN